MKKYIIAIAILLQATYVVSQTYYQQGTEYLKKGNYIKADSLFTLSIEGIPNKNAFYNRAITRMYKGDKKGFCLDLKSAAEFKDAEAGNLHKSKCLEIDTVKYSDTYTIVSDNWFLTEIIEKERYYDLTEGRFYDAQDKLIAEYKIKKDYKWFEKLPNKPDYIGGERKLWKFINSELKYPESENNAYEKYSGGFATVYVEFDISTNGQVCNVQVAEFKREHTMKNISKNFTQEALRVINLLPDFEIPTFMDNAVVFRYVVPIKFEFPK